MQLAGCRAAGERVPTSDASDCSGLWIVTLKGAEGQRLIATM